MAVTVYTQHDTDYFIQKQATWGTANVTTMHRLGCEPTDIEPDLKVRLPNRAQRARVRPRVAWHNDFKGAMPKVNLKGVARVGDVKHFLFGAMQDVTAQTGTTPNFQTTFKFPSATAGQPDFTAGVTTNWVGTFVKQNATTGRSKQLVDCIARKVRFSGKEGADSRMMYDVELVGRGTPDLGTVANPTSPADPTLAFYDFYDITVSSIGTTPIVVQEYDITITNNAFPIGTDLSNAGKFLTWGLNPYDVEVKLKVLWSTLVHDLQKLIASEADSTSTQTPLVLTFGTSSSSGYLQFTMQTCWSPATDDDGATKSVQLTGKLIWPTAVTNVEDSFVVVHCGLPDFTSYV